MSLFSFKAETKCSVELGGLQSRGSILAKVIDSAAPKRLWVYASQEDVCGRAVVTLGAGKSLEHYGIRLELLGRIQVGEDASRAETFLTIAQEICRSGTLTESKSFDFAFRNVQKPYESYYGHNVRLRYCVRLSVLRGYAARTLEHEEEFAVQLVKPSPESNPPIKMEVGIEECLHLEFQYDKSRYHLKDCLTGKVDFRLVRVKIKFMELAVVRKESAGTGFGLISESDTITKFEVMDGVPVKGETIPLRFYLAPLGLTPTFRAIHHRFTVKYYVNIVVVDEEDRRYFKQHEISLWRKSLEGQEHSEASELDDVEESVDTNEAQFVS